MSATSVLCKTVILRYFGTSVNTQQWAQPVTAWMHGVSSRKCQLEAVDCGISLDRDSVSNEFQACVVLGKKNTCIYQYKQPE